MIELPKTVGTIGGGNMAEAILQGLLQDGQTRLVLDLRDVERFGSLMLGLLLRRVQLFRRAGGDIRLMRVPQRVGEILNVLGLGSHFKSVPDEATALTDW